MSKKRIVKDYGNLPEDVLAKLKKDHPYGFADHLITFTNAKGEKISALPFETDEIYYLVRMTKAQAISYVEDDDDYDEFGNLDESMAMGDEEDL